STCSSTVSMAVQKGQRLREAGQFEVAAVGQKVLVTTLGNSRMGTDPAQAVVDPDGRSFDVPNLYICDNSVFPSALAANPALTQMALALRTAERFLAR
ncbi:GMC family oxidoreductase, partial [Xanthomonas phaseoli]|uniref:GMC family oxidoreductase n=2 Tax=Xanthomonas phaseoli TaxID=1985254 RepID=UPI001ED97196